MWKLKGCIRCGGDVFIAKDTDGWYQECLQCSHRRDLPTQDKRRRKPGAVETVFCHEGTASQGPQPVLARRPGE